MSEKNGNKQRKCPRCGNTKELTIGNFKKRKNDKDYSVWCRSCLNAETAKRYRQRKMREPFTKEVKCNRVTCDETFIRKRAGAMYCSKYCKRHAHLEKQKIEREMLKNKPKKKEINSKWLVRGRISGIHY